MKREDVYRLIEGERIYQDTDPHDAGHDDKARVVADWAIFIETQIGQCKEAIYNLKEDTALEHIRKIAALSVACMEYNETNPRIIKQ